jgi:hypothetical protein
MLKCPLFYFAETFSGHSSLFAASFATVRRRIKVVASSRWRAQATKNSAGRKVQLKC